MSTEKSCILFLATELGLSSKPLQKSWDAFNDNKEWVMGGTVVSDLEAWVNDLCALKMPFGVSPVKLETAFQKWLTT